MRRSAMMAAVFVLAASAAGPTAVEAAPTYTGSYVFGDSLSDRGNAAEYLAFQPNSQNPNGFPNPPSYHDSFTNGDVAVQVMAQRLGFNADPSLWTTFGQDKLGLTRGPNYAVGGATAAGSTDFTKTPDGNLPSQVYAYLTSVGNKADPNALYTVFIGGNDVRAATGSNNSAFVTAGESAEIQQIKNLYAGGARNFLVVNVPDIGKIPGVLAAGPVAVAVAESNTMLYNSLLGSDVKGLMSSLSQASFTYFDLYAYEDTILLPNIAAYGITDLTDPCYTQTAVNPGTMTDATSSACGGINPSTNQATNIDSFFYWDNIHPTAKVQGLLGNALADAVLGIPEASTWAMMIAGLGFVGAMLRRRRRTPAPV